MTAAVDLTREKDVAAACDALASAMGYDVISTSQARASSVTAGMPDRYYRHVPRGIRLWWEVKREGDKLTREQHQFLTRELDAGGYACCGTRRDLQIVLSCRFATLQRCRDIVGVWAARGFRHERKDGSPRRRRTAR